jgi:hypothetical protein
VRSVDEARVDKSAFEIVSLDDSGDRDYWRSKTLRERMEALELKLLNLNDGSSPLLGTSMG